MSWLQDHGWVVGAIIAAVLALAGLAWRSARRPPAPPVPGAAARRRVDLTFAAAVAVTLTVGLVVVLWLLGQAGQVPPGKDRATLQADAVRTGAAIALGTGGAAYLLLAYRRQRLDEVDTRERRITELYTKAVEQLGHEKAPVRLGALYSLERLAQDNPEHRQTVVDVVCAYLRMPYTPPARPEPDAEQVEEAAPLADDHGQAPYPTPGQDPAQELEVRQTAQRILAAHLRLPWGTSSGSAQRRRPSPRQAFWPGINLDLTGATLVKLNFDRVSAMEGWFIGAAFYGGAFFQEASFEDVWFNRATFQGDVWFPQAAFRAAAWFTEATFQGRAGFSAATFQGLAGFDRATFQGLTDFHRSAFQDLTVFTRATFQGLADFAWSTFQDHAEFNRATFQGDAEFNSATFQRAAGFDRATFQRGAEFDGATFQADAVYIDATFHGGVGFDGAQVLHLDDPDLNERRYWPDGCTVRPDPADPTRGTLVGAEQVEKSDPVIPLSDGPATNPRRRAHVVDPDDGGD
jgi:uncharacterized protein YjbI with pentapeptide repeats